MNYYAVIGNPISHSISPFLHNTAFMEFSRDNIYSRVLFPKDISPIQFKEKFLSLSLSGANVTVPFKEIAFLASDEPDTYAKKICSVNTLMVKESKILSFNTDAPGFLKAIEEFSNDIGSALVLGAGGTAKAICAALFDNDVKVSILNRSHKNFYSNDYQFFTPENFVPDSYDIVINATPAGLTFDGLPFKEEILSPILANAKYAFDVVYNKNTDFLKLANHHNLKYKDGKDMLLYQAVFAFDIFTEQEFDIEKITQVMRASFAL